MRWTDTLTETDRVRAHTAPEAQAIMDRALEERLAGYADAGDDEIAARLYELDTEWDIERVLEVNAATVAALGISASALTRRRLLLALPLAVALFLLQHGLQGWCPPLALFRRRQVRTRREIDLERYALKALRGDLPDGTNLAAGEIPALLDAAARRRPAPGRRVPAR